MILTAPFSARQLLFLTIKIETANQNVKEKEKVKNSTMKRDERVMRRKLL